MIEIKTLPVMMRLSGRRFVPTFQGAILNGLLVTWRCRHAHFERREAILCAEYEAQMRDLPISSREDTHEGLLVND